MKIFFGPNVRLLRKRKGLTQEDLAKEIKTTRSTINNYENGVQPSIDNLMILSDHFKINIDTLLRTDMGKLSKYQLQQLERGDELYIKGSKLRVLATTIDSNNKENIELVNHKAKAGYTEGYNDPEFISGLPTFQLPFLSKERKYRMFQLDGDSMLPIPDKAHVVGEFLQNWNEIKDGHAYIFLTKDDGVIFKIAFNQIRKKKNLLLRSLNPEYKPFELDIENVKEVWSFVNYFSSTLPDEAPDVHGIISKLDELKNEALKLTVR